MSLAAHLYRSLRNNELEAPVLAELLQAAADNNTLTDLKLDIDLPETLRIALRERRQSIRLPAAAVPHPSDRADNIGVGVAGSGNKAAKATPLVRPPDAGDASRRVLSRGVGQSQGLAVQADSVDHYSPDSGVSTRMVFDACR